VKTMLLVISCFLTMFAAVSAYAGDSVFFNANIPFEFNVGKKVYPAGVYRFNANPSVLTGTIYRSPRSFTIKGPRHVKGAVLVRDRLPGEIEATPNDVRIVFDRTGHKRTLSEIWVPGKDGYVLSTTKEEHTLEVVDAPE
jgi:hypothetical protein